MRGFNWSRYIFGDNSGGRLTEEGGVEPQKVAMTAPVRTEQPQKIAMTSPVQTVLRGDLRKMKVSFVMPKKVRKAWQACVQGGAGLRNGAADYCS